MITSFNCTDTERLFFQKKTVRFIQIEQAALRKLYILHAATTLKDLSVPPGNRLESLTGDRKGQYSIRINKQWRLCFIWSGQNANNVEIVDYH